MSWADFLLNFDQKAETLPEGEGWQTMQQVIKDSPWGDNKTREVIREAIQEGRVETFEGYRRIKSRLVRQRWYRYK